MAYKDKQRALEYYRAYNAKRRVAPVKSARQIAVEQGETHYFTGKPCVHGHIAKRRTNDRKCMECEAQVKGVLRKQDPEAARMKGRETYARHKQQALKNKRLYRQANKGKINALNARRKKVIKQRTPKWLTEEEFWMIREAYELAALRTKMLGFAWHVDHVIPLQGKTVSGLHVPTNLQVIPGLDNIVKKNKYEVNHA